MRLLLIGIALSVLAAFVFHFMCGIPWWMATYAGGMTGLLTIAVFLVFAVTS